ncbi:hypothetical protein SS7213T_03100, partial [Staphylococcus simiae CCM 7213 = CCUG 51256]
CGRHTKLNIKLKDKIIHHLKLHWLPEQIVGRLLHNQICFKTI